MNLSKISESNYKTFNRMFAVKKAAYISTVQYIELLASQTNTDIKAWNLLKIFGTGSGKNFHTDKKQINKRFFAHLEKVKAKVESQVVAIEAKVAARMDKLSGSDKTIRSTRIAAMKERQAKLIQRAVACFSVADSYIAKAAELGRRIDSAEKTAPTFSDQISQIIRENFWGFHSLNNACLSLVTKNDIILSHINPAANLNLRVNLGKFRVFIHFDEMRLSVQTHGNNVVVGHPHPHIGSEGTICWGDASSLVAEKRAKGEIADVLRLLASVLTNYNPGGPFVQLHRFVEAAAEMRAR